MLHPSAPGCSSPVAAVGNASPSGAAGSNRPWVQHRAARPHRPDALAFVIVRDPDDPDSLDAAALVDHAARHLAAYKRPREIVFVDSLPRTANGKIRRRELAERYGTHI